MAVSSAETYVAVSRGRSAVTFREGEEWTVRGFPAGTAAVDVTFRTAYVSLGFDAKVPRWLYAEVSGPAESLEDAIRRFPNAVRSLTPIVDVALNASVEDLDLHLGFDATPDREERGFFQNFLRDDPPTLRQARPANVGFLSHLTMAIARDPDNVRLHRASAHYQQALRFWSFGDETRAVGQLWMGFEALTPVVKRREMTRTGTSSPSDLAAALGIELKSLDGTLRRTVLFEGDTKAYGDTKEASDGFEHGYLPLDKLRVIARGTRDASAGYLRKAIITLSGVPEPTAAHMLREPYDTPIIGFPITKYLRGVLQGGGDPAPPGDRYPSVTWRSDIKTFRLRDDGRNDVQWNESITPKIAPGTQLTAIRIELWSGDRIPAGSATMQRASIECKGERYDLPSPGQQPALTRWPRVRWRFFLRRLRQLITGRSDR